MKKIPVKAVHPEQLIQDAVQLVRSYPKVPLTVDCVIFGFEENKLKILLIKSDLALYKGKYSLLGDFVRDNEELDAAAYRILKERTGMDNVFLDQVKAFGSPARHPGGRVITIAYCSLLNIQHHALKIHDNELNWVSLASLKEMAFDHKEIVDVCYQWLQKRIQEHPLGFNLLPKNSPFVNYRISTKRSWGLPWTGETSGKNSLPWIYSSIPMKWNRM